MGHKGIPVLLLFSARLSLTSCTRFKGMKTTDNTAARPGDQRENTIPYSQPSLVWEPKRGDDHKMSKNALAAVRIQTGRLESTHSSSEQQCKSKQRRKKSLF